ncbi:MAG TPA: hypothetical protein PLG47_02970 [Candidatus Dojkabacteria bacterium]|nr:hypothetical protein [Candidatus Dojkabacteria bacterium]
MNRRYSAYLKTRTQNSWGGSWADSKSYSAMFRSDESPHDLGLIDVEVFTKAVDSNIVNKPLTFMAGKNRVPLPGGGGGKVTWKLATQGVTRSTIVGVDPNLGTTPGLAGTTFKVALDRGFYHEPVLLKTDSTNAPMLRILGYPYEEAPGKWWYTVKLQTGDATAYVPVEFLQIGRTCKDASTSVSDEMNEKFAGIEFGSTMDLGSHIGYFARHFEVDDKLIRKEIEARKKGANYNVNYNKGGMSMTSFVGQNYVIAPNGMDANDTRVVQKGKLISAVEYMLRDKLYMDMEMAFHFGQTEVTTDPDSGYQTTFGSGWFQIARETNYDEHDGSNLTLGQFVDKLDALRFNVVSPKNDVVEVHTGREGMKLASRLIELEATALPFTLQSSYFIDEVPSNATNYGLAFGSQFVEFRNFGQTIRFVWSPMKDNMDVFRELDPETGKPKESSSFDIYYLGDTSAAPADAYNKSNMAIAHEPAAEVWATVSNVYDFTTCAIQNGGQVASYSKECAIKMEKSAGLLIWDVSGCARIARV